MEEFILSQENYFKLQTRAFEAAFRIEDDQKQAMKGQPSLNVEETGAKFRNDPVTP